MDSRIAVKGSSLPIVGRDAEVAALMRLLADARAGSARWVVVEGEPGIGKTRLAAEIVERADEGFTVLRATGEELQRDRPFGLVIDALGVDNDATREELQQATTSSRTDHRRGRLGLLRAMTDFTQNIE